MHGAHPEILVIASLAQPGVAIQCQQMDCFIAALLAMTGED